MPYSKTPWTDFVTPANATNMNHIETGISNASLGVYNIAEYGTVVNDNTTDTFPAIKAAVLAAGAAGGGVVQIPAGNYAISVPNDNVGAQVATGANVIIRGASRDATVLTYSGGALSAFTPFFSTSASGATLTMEDLTVNGPSNPNALQSYMAWHQGSSGSLTLRRVNTTLFPSPVYIQTGATCTLLVEECSFNSPGVAPTTFQVGIQNILRARVYDTDFNGYGLSASNQAHGIYVYQSVDFEAHRCTFTNNNGVGWSIQSFNGTGTSGNFAVSDCYFSSTSYQGVLTNPTVRSRIENCRFVSVANGVTVQFDCDILGCQFTGQSTHEPIGQATQAGNFRVHGCHFSLPTTGTFAININQNGSVCRVEGSTFTCNFAWAITVTGTGTYFLATTNDYVDDGIAHQNAATNITAPTLTNVNANVNTTSVTGNDIRGVVQFNVITGTIAAGSLLFTVVPQKNWSAAPFVQVTAAAADVQAVGFGVSGTGAGGFSVRNLAALPISTAIKMFYFVIG